MWQLISRISDEKGAMKWMESIKNLFSKKSLERLQESRRRVVSNMKGERHPAAISITIGLALICVVTLITTTWVPTDMQSYMSTRPDIYSLAQDQFKWTTSGLVDTDCDINVNCHTQLNHPALVQEISLDEFDKITAYGERDLKMLINLEVKPEAVKNLLHEPTFVIALPMFRYYQAEVYLGKRHVNTFFRSKRLYLTLESEAAKKQKDVFAISIVFHIKPAGRNLAGVRQNEGVFVATQREFSLYQEFQTAKSARGVGSMGHVAKVVLALFCLLLFLIVDSSPESLGLALFMGFEAAAMGTAEGWFPLGWLGIEREKVWVNFFFQMGDLFKLYFILQLARVGHPRVIKWLLVCGALSLPYGFFMQYASDHSWGWVYKIPRSRDTLVGGLGFLICVYALIGLRGKPIPWRKTALAIGGLAALTEVINSWLAHSNIIRVHPEYRSLFTIMQANTGYLFALSTFLNISSLERRAAAGGNAGLNASEQDEQGAQALAMIPRKEVEAVPNALKLASEYYSSGHRSEQACIVEWNPQKETLYFLATEGPDARSIEASLKAFTEGPLIGGEFNLENRELILHRHNACRPFLFTPQFEWRQGRTERLDAYWKVEILPVSNRKEFHIKLQPGSVLVLLSESYISGSRRGHSFSQDLLSQLEQASHELNPDQITALASEWAERHLSDAELPRLVVVFQWDPLAAHAELPVSA